jgi:hypothetical protein
MKTIRFRTRVASLLSAIVLVFQISPAVAFGMQGAWQNHQRFEVTFTKWITGSSPSGTLLMAGFTRGDAFGDFAGEVLTRKVSTDGRTVLLQPIYQVKAGDRSFTALILGGENSTGYALLDGVILEGWRTGARVHVEFQMISECKDPAGVTHKPCFQGTISILPDSEHD